MTVPTPLQIALRQSRTRPTVVSGSIAGVGGGIAGPSKTVVGAVPAGSSMKLESSDDRRPDHKAR